jgi:hypothetical protein
MLINRAQTFTLDPSRLQLLKNHEFETSHIHGNVETILFCLAIDVSEACLPGRGSKRSFWKKAERKSSKKYLFLDSLKTSNSTL